jgi:AraC-like DNA-binding protein
VAQGVRQEDLLAQSLIEPKRGDIRDRISPAQLLLLCMNANLSVADATHGLAARRLPIAFAGVGLRAVAGCLTLEGGLNSLQRLYVSIGSPVRLKLKIEGEDAFLMIEGDGRTMSASYTIEDTYLTWMYMHCAWFLGRPPPISEVCVRDPSHVGLGGLHFAIPAPVRLGRCSALRFRKSLLAEKRTGRGSDTPIWDCMRPWLDAFDRGGDVDGAARWSLRVDELARDAGVSASTLRRRLSASDGGYRRARRHAFAEAGLNLLRSSDASVDSVAAELGFADARSFRRFMKDAIGKTPSEIRLEAGRDSASPSGELLRQRVRETALRLDHVSD